MNILKKLKGITGTAGELALLVGIIAIGGLVLPIHIAPYLADVFSVTTPYEAQRQTMSVQISNRNASHGETVSIGVSDPASSVRIQSLSYSCDTVDVRLAYVQDGGLREIPCGTDLVLPPSTQHNLAPLTSREEITFLPVSITLSDTDVTGTLSAVITTAASGADEKSPLSDESTATLRSFFQK
jgi:hypothetical protein